MKIVFYTSGSAGSGRFVRGISVGNALTRRGSTSDFIILSNSKFAHLADDFGIDHLEIRLENDRELSKDNFRSSMLYATLKELQPDVLIVDLLWFPLHFFIDQLDCLKIFICHQVMDNFFSIQEDSITMSFDPAQYDYLVSIEPFRSAIDFDSVNPLILRNRDEILSREAALEKLNLQHENLNALFAINARPGDFDQLKMKYSYLEEQGCDVTYSTNYEGGIFPVIDYFNAFDLVICLAGYNQYWECRYFGKKSIFETIPLHFSSMEERIATGNTYTFEENGADQLVEIILNG